MLSIAEVSGLIAAAVIIVQYILPAALAVILVKHVGTENSAATWGVINRAIGTTLWPHIVRADAITTGRIPSRILLPNWTATAGAVLLVLAGVLTPLGLHEEIVTGGSTLVEFQYVPDLGPWGRVTMARPNAAFSRVCELGLTINCPGQYQGVDMQEIEPGHFESVESDENSIINTTIPANFTTMFTSATLDRGNTISGLFDIQYRRWEWVQQGLFDRGQPYVRGASRHIGSLITEDKVLVTEGLIVDMTENPGIGFRNHTIPVGLDHGGTWSEDITWIEPVTQCADTNLSIEFRLEDNAGFSDNATFFIVDRGAFQGLDSSTLETPPWNDNQTLNLFGRAHKAARMHNVLVASSLNISLPIDEAIGILPKMLAKDAGVGGSAPVSMYSEATYDTVILDALAGVGGVPSIRDPTSANSSVPFVPGYPDGAKKLVALNYTAITQICRGYYSLAATGNDWRANNITYPAVQCGIILGAPVQMPDPELSLSTYSNVSTYLKNLYVCASGIRASIKDVEFRYNGTEGRFENLAVLNITDKDYPDPQSEPLWAAEHSYNKSMKFDPLWGIVDNRYEAMGYNDGFYTLRAKKLWLPTSPFLVTNFGEREGYDSLAAASGFHRRLGNLYGGSLSSLDNPDYTGQYDFTLLERFQRLSSAADRAAQIPSLILTDGLAAGLVGTKTAISQQYVPWPASLAADNTSRGIPRARVTVYKRVIRYDLRYAIPGFLVLALFLITLLWSAGILATSHSTVTHLRNVYNQTSAGRLATNLLLPNNGDPRQPSSEWVSGDGRLMLNFGQLTEPRTGKFCTTVGGEGSGDGKSASDGKRTPTPTGEERVPSVGESGSKERGVKRTASTTVPPI